MLKEKVTQVLRDRFSKVASEEKISQTAEELTRVLGEEWEEIEVAWEQLGPSVSVQCKDICVLAEHIIRGDELMFFRRTKPSNSR